MQFNQVPPYGIVSETKAIQDPEKNLRSKLESLTRSLESLVAKRDRIDFEIRQQKKALIRKREELKRSSKHSRSKASHLSENSSQLAQIELEILESRIRNDSKLLQESNQILEKLESL